MSGCYITWGLTFIKKLCNLIAVIIKGLSGFTEPIMFSSNIARQKWDLLWRSKGTCGKEQESLPGWCPQQRGSGQRTYSRISSHSRWASYKFIYREGEKLIILKCIHYAPMSPIIIHIQIKVCRCVYCIFESVQWWISSVCALFSQIQIVLHTIWMFTICSILKHFYSFLPLIQLIL